MQTTKEQEQTILWSMLHEPGDGLARALFDLRGVKLLEDFERGRAKKLWPELVPQEYRSGIADLIERIELRIDRTNPISAIERGIRWNFRPLFPTDAPRLFEKLDDLHPHQPFLLWIAGDHGFLHDLTVSVVGTRWPSPKGLENAAKLVQKLSLPIVSGGAIGIDAAAHQAAMDTGLPTAAVMAGGLDRAYPQVNWELFHKIVQQGGAMLSEMAPGSAPTRFRFLQRNRLIAALSPATFVVEAGYRSGTINTANHARLLGRDVYALVGPKESPAARGCNSMVASGLALPFQLQTATGWVDQRRLDRIEDARRNGAKTAVEIARDSGLPLREVRAALAS